MKEKPATVRTTTVVFKPKKHFAPVPIEDKPAEQLLADLIGILSNRKELLEKIIKKFPRSHDGHKTFEQYFKQTKKFLKELLAELSAYGDGSADPDHNNAYNDYWIAALKKWDTFNQHRLILFWRALETILHGIYTKMLTQVLTPSFETIVTRQLAELESFRTSKKN